MVENIQIFNKKIQNVYKIKKMGANKWRNRWNTKSQQNDAKIERPVVAAILWIMFTVFFCDLFKLTNHDSTRANDKDF